MAYTDRIGRPWPTEEREPGGLAWIGVLVRHPWLAVVTPLVVAAVVGTYALLRPRDYTASASFTPRTTDVMKGALSGLAAQLGVTATGDPSQSPDFYADLLTSRPILAAVAESTYTLPPGDPLGRAGTGVALLEAEGQTPALRLDDAVKRLAKRVTVTKNAKTGVVTFSVTTRSPALSTAMTGHVLSLVDQFNQERRKQKAADEERFAEQRMQQLRSELNRAEDALAYFKARNRDAQAPDLEKEQERLEREVGMRQTVFTNIAQVYEQARVDALRDVPVITVIEAPTPPVRPDSRRVALKVLLALMLAVPAGFGIALLRDAVQRDVMPTISAAGGWRRAFRDKHAGREGTTT
ncbi:lipopolysaccharide biosynthesis protein [Gemmatirosa kalamazoonensis]|uniref:Lipopolysaccharide biosynthesis protein n=1 Tax=Gemmatirosa kalamazoonensis TaxID=861299 RepID=W0RIU9_9BACT|nr:hypothetical protein [Gemmatirosa kalamazoonensis]AHG91029.1 lipopolysaccharide biosynthesis protein [Gemmatirosa kalamazoonensis]